MRVQYHLRDKAAAPKRVSGKMKVMLQRAEDALFLSSRTFATKSALSGSKDLLRYVRTRGKRTWARDELPRFN